MKFSLSILAGPLFVLISFSKVPSLGKSLVVLRPAFENLQISDRDTLCIIDSAAILENSSLDYLVMELKRSKLKETHVKKGVPDLIWKYLNCTHHGDFSIANPGEKWQVTDVVFEKLPARQLIFYAGCDSIAMMTFYKGGIGRSQHILIFKLNKEQVTNFWCGFAREDVKTPEEVIRLIKKYKEKHWGLNTDIIYF